MIREIVNIDDEKCNGCGLCVPNCHEGALQIIDGKARLISELMCDGLGACLGHCPEGAITIEKREAATKGLPSNVEVKLEPKSGRFGGAVKFSKSNGPIVFFKADKNFSAPAANWTGSVSFWLKTDMANDLAEGFCDPVQITSKQWDDASFFVEFEKRATGIPFRLGVYADKPVWNPTNRKFEDIPVGERPLVVVAKPPFNANQWTHVAFTFERFNSGKQDGIATLYLNGEQQGELADRTQTYSWDPSKSAVMLGLSYIGMMDDFGLFDRALTTDEIVYVYGLKNGLSELR